MLCLTRRTNEEIVFQVKDENGKITEFSMFVNSIEDGQVRIGFEAPASVRILRGELVTQ